MNDVLKALLAAQHSNLQVSRQLLDWTLKNHIDAAALKDSVKALDPTFEDTYRQKREDVLNDAEESRQVAHMKRSIDDMMRSLEEMQQILQRT